jgi:Ca2+-transporting ATPase
VLRAAQVDAEHGLSSAEAASRAGQFGPNKLAAARAEPRWQAFVRQYSDPMQIVLVAAGVLSLFPLGQLGTGMLLILLTAGDVRPANQGGRGSVSASWLRRPIGSTTTSA